MSLLVSWDRLTAISNDCKYILDIDEIDDIGVRFYEGGMVDVLKEVAAYHFKSSDERQRSKQTMMLRKSLEKIEMLLKRTLGNEHEKLLRDYSDAVTTLIAFECEDEYIYGFIDSYMFFKKSRYGK